MGELCVGCIELLLEIYGCIIEAKNSNGVIADAEVARALSLISDIDACGVPPDLVALMQSALRSRDYLKAEGYVYSAAYEVAEFCKGDK